jgi:multidrug efflux pump subunit AcrA (membrane-fusion protein)
MDSAPLPFGGRHVWVYVKEGDYVAEGQELYRINSSAAEEAVVTARTALANRQKELDALYKELGELTVRAPFSGQLRSVGTFEIGNTVSKGAKVATLVDDTRLKLSVYLSMLRNSVWVGQKVSFRFPPMSTLDGAVETINYVRASRTKARFCLRQSLF